MVRADVLSGAAFRAVLHSAALFVVILVVMGALAARLIDRTMTQTLRLDITEMEVTLRHLVEDEGRVALRHQVEQLSRTAVGTGYSHALIDGEGRLLAGRAELLPPPTEWERRRIAADEGAPRAVGHEALLHSAALDDLTLVTGRDLSGLQAAKVSALRGLAIAGFLVVVSMLAAGYLMSRGSQRKLEAIEATLDRVSRGEVGARIGDLERDSQIGRIARRIDHHLAQLETLMGATRRTGAAIAHDLRRPLARARISLERALERAESGADTRGDLEASIAEIEALTRIIATILRIARIESGEAGDLAQQFDLAALLDELAETYETVAEDAGQELVLEIAARPLAMRGDREMVAQMVVNLVQNAISHAGADARITVSARRRMGGGPLELEVRDSGQGIAPGHLGEVLEPFFRTDAARTSDGSGLGLTLVRAIAERHGAQLRLRDARPGLAVTVDFPATPGARLTER